MSKAKLTFYKSCDTEIIIKEEVALARIAWPTFMLQDPVAWKYFGELYSNFNEFQFGLIEESSDKLVAVGNCIPLYFDQPLAELPARGWDWALQKGCEDFKNNIKPNLLCAIQVMLDPDYLGQGLSSQMVGHMRQIGIDAGLDNLIAPVRPNKKTDYPMISINDYITWKSDDNFPFDPWLRVHSRLGASILHPCEKSMLISGKISDWEEWTGMKFPQNGNYPVPGALSPISIDLESNTGLYTEPNVWMVHKLKE